MLQNKRRLLALSLGLLMTLTSFWGCVTEGDVTPTQTSDTIPQTTAPFEKEDPVLPVTPPGEGNMENVAQIRLRDVPKGWTKRFESPSGTFFVATSVQMLMDGLVQRGIDVAGMNLSAYDDGFFAKNRLVVIPRTSNSGSVRYTAKVEQTADGVSISTVGKMPEIGTADMADWLVLVPLSYAEYTGKVVVENGKSPVTNVQRYAVHRY